MTALSDIPDNHAVRWDGTRFGLFPTLSAEAASIIPQGQSRIPALLEAIQSLHHFVTAHVLLTQITAIQYDSFPGWNGLQIDLQATGEVYIDPEQRYTLAKRWQLYFHTEPRPTTLPNN